MENQNSDMNRGERSVRVRRWVLLGIVLLAFAAVATVWLLMRGSSHSSVAGRPVPAPEGAPIPAPPGAPSDGAAPQPGEIVITLSSDKLDNARIKTEVVTAQAGMAPAGAVGIRTTGTIQSNAYKEVPVFPIAGGITREVNVQLGEKVRHGQPLATIFSTELANAQGDYLKMAAELEEHHKHHQRAIELVEIGAMSREELEGAVSKYKAAQANLSSARQRLILLGMSPKEVDALTSSDQVRSLVSVPAPVSGTVISRTVNPGEVVASGKELFRVADLSSVWVMGQVYESDFARVHLGSPTVITTAAYPGRTFTGRVSYIDPRVDPQTRTAQVRIELANPGEMLRIGMFVDVSFGAAAQAGTSGQPAVVVSRAAVQSIGTKQVVFVAADRPGVFVQREVSAGPETNGLVTIYSGVNPGERVVTEGSFLLRAESLKLNPSQSTSAATASPVAPTSMPNEPSHVASAQRDAGVQAATVTVTEKGYKPDTIKLKQGILARVTFVRDVEATCATAVLIPEYNIKRDLPFKEPVVVEFMPSKRGMFDFTCGMGMLSGKIIVR